jgi:hypothetical protein
LDFGDKGKITLTHEEAIGFITNIKQLKHFTRSKFAGKENTKERSKIIYLKNKANDMFGNNDLDRAKYYADKVISEVEKHKDSLKEHDIELYQNWYRDFLLNLHNLKKAA